VVDAAWETQNAADAGQTSATRMLHGEDSFAFKDKNRSLATRSVV
jgi:hypothetical protein